MKDDKAPMSMTLKSILLGGAEFDEREEYFRFQFRFLYLLLIYGAASSGLFVIAHHFGANILPEAHVANQKVHSAISIILMIVMYNRKKIFTVAAWIGLANTFYILVSAFFLVPGDPLRVVWFFTLIPAVFFLLGRPVGIATTVASCIFVIAGNRYLPEPYNANALTTSFVAFLYMGIFFATYSSRPVSYFHRMLESNEKLRYLANHDPMTGLLNSRTFHEVCNHMMCVAYRENELFSLLFVDLDHFKKINDTYGHEAGDIVLKTVTKYLSSTNRACDVYGRIGGEEFCVYLPETDLDGAKAFAEKIRSGIEQLLPIINGSPLKVTASIGVASKMAHHASISDIQRDADHAMYHAKKEGRNRVSCLEMPCYVEQAQS